LFLYYFALLKMASYSASEDALNYVLEILLKPPQLTKKAQVEFQDAIFLMAGLEVVVPDGTEILLHLI
jgi:hypothetical protein